MSKDGRKGGEVVEFLLVGWLVDPVEDGDLTGGQSLGDRIVGQQHELLDQPVAVQPAPGRDSDGHAVPVERDFRLGEVEVDRPALDALSPQFGPNALEQADVLSERSGLRIGIAGNGGLGLLVAQATPTANGRLFDPGVDECAR